jgi:hypothetical protein
MNMNEYNTQKSALKLKEYGRNIQKLVDYVLTIEDRETRTKYALTLIELMKQIVPSVKDGPEYAQKLWDDLYLMSDFSLDVDSPFPLPEKDLLGKKPKRLSYNKEEVRFKHYGKNIEYLIKKAINLEDPAEKEAAIIYIGKLMKSFYMSWNKEVTDDAVIIENLKQLSNGQLYIDPTRVKENNLFDFSTKEKVDRNERQDRNDRQDRGSDKGRKNRKQNTSNKRRKN